MRVPSALGAEKGGKTKVAVIWTGGTMGSNQEMRGDKLVSKPGFTGSEFGSRFLPEDMRRAYDFKWLPAIPEKPKGIDSTEMTLEMMERVVAKVREVLIDPAFRQHRVIVTHGTDTLAQSAAYASFALQGLDRPVIFTGAQIAPTVMHSDAVHNFGLAVQAAGLKTGQVLAAFGSRIMRGVAVSKEEGVEPGVTFGSPHQPMVAQLAGTSIVPDDKMMDTPASHLSSFRYLPGMQGEAYIVRFSPNLNDASRMRKVLDNDYDAVILEGYAAGNIPTKIADVIREAAERMMVIITPSTATHGAHESLYEVSAEIAHPSAQHFVGPSHVALTKFQWLFRRAREIGLTNVKGDMRLLAWVREKFRMNFVGEDLRAEWHDSVPVSEYLHTDILIRDFHRKFATSALFNLPPAKNAEDERHHKKLAHSAKLSDIHLQMRKAWLEKHVDSLIADGSLDPKERCEWVRQRESLDFPVEWITNTGVAPHDNPLFIFLKSAFVDAYQFTPYKNPRSEEYVFSDHMYQYFGLNAPLKKPVSEE